MARHVEKGADFYAGPFLPAKLARRTMALSHRLFGIRSCNEVITGQRGRPCLEYDIKRCIAPCVAEICGQERYGEAVAETKLLLEGRNDELLETSAQQDDGGRRGAAIRRGRAAARRAANGAGAARPAAEGRDAWTRRPRRVRTEGGAERGRAPGVRRCGEAGWSSAWSWRPSPERIVPREADVLQAALQQFYEGRVPPVEVHLPLEIEDADALEAWLSERAGRKVRILVPRRGDKRALVELATRNAELSYRTRFNEITAAHFDALETLRATLGLPVIPRRIECFDISTIQGSETVASMVVCEDGRMKKSEYRKFRIRGIRDRGSGIRVRQ